MNEQVMGSIVDHLEKCEASVMGLIMFEINKHGINRAKMPFSLVHSLCDKAHTDKPTYCWYVYIEVDMRALTCDIEVEDPDLAIAVGKALSALRRQFRTAAA